MIRKDDYRRYTQCGSIGSTMASTALPRSSPSGSLSSRLVRVILLTRSLPIGSWAAPIIMEAISGRPKSILSPRSAATLHQVISGAQCGFTTMVGFLPQARLARVLWMRGAADKAIQVAEESFQEAGAGEQKLLMCFVLGEILCPLHLMAGDIGAATRSVTMLGELAARYGFAFWVRFGRGLDGTLLIKRGDVAQGAALLPSALEALGSAGQTLHCSGFIARTSPRLWLHSEIGEKPRPSSMRRSRSRGEMTSSGTCPSCFA
jgi:hypothetical protein